MNDFRWEGHVSNSHNAPIGKKTNWCDRDQNEPTGYPGWKMNIEYQVVGQEDTHTYPYSGEAWAGTGINTGTGGYARNYYFQCNLFAADWPAMADVYEKAKIWAALNGDKRKIDTIVDSMYSVA